MPRRKRLRKIVAPPRFVGFKPYGTIQKATGTVELLYEEYEAIKLVDYDLMNHKQASELMGVSRATLARIYETARRKMAMALVEIKEIKAVYGNAWMEKNWYVCHNCDARFTIPLNLNEKHCAICSSPSISLLKTDDKQLSNQ